VSLWRRLRGAPSEPLANPRRWIVVDVESSGLDVGNDRLLALAAVALQLDGDASPRITLADSFEAVVQQEAALADKPNILLHGIGVGEQRAGAPAVGVFSAFERWVADAPLIAFHAAFDEAMIRRAMKAALGRTLPNPWLDLEPLADVLYPAVGGHALDDWLLHFGIECSVRHQAAADTLATAELLLRLWPAVRCERSTSFAKLRRLAEHRPWLTKR